MTRSFDAALKDNQSSTGVAVSFGPALRGGTSPSVMSGWRLHSEHQQSLVPAHCVAHRDDHDRQPAICVDALCRPDAEADGLGAVRHSRRVHSLHPVSDLGAATRWLARRSARTALVHHRGRPAVRPRLGRDGIRDSSLPMLYTSYCAAGMGAAFVYSCSIGSALKWFKEKRGLASGIMAAGFGGGTALFIPVISSLIADARLSGDVRRDRDLSGTRHPDRRPVPEASSCAARCTGASRRGWNIADRQAAVHDLRDVDARRSSTGCTRRSS